MYVCMNELKAFLHFKKDKATIQQSFTSCQTAILFHDAYVNEVSWWYIEQKYIEQKYIGWTYIENWYIEQRYIKYQYMYWKLG
jgi:hypothetical protein